MEWITSLESEFSITGHIQLEAAGGLIREGIDGIPQPPKFLSLFFFFIITIEYNLYFFFEFFLYSRFLLVIYFIHISVYMSILISQFIPPPPPPLSPLGVHMFVLYICVSISALQTGSSVPFFEIPHICINTLYLFFSF